MLAVLPRYRFLVTAARDGYLGRRGDWAISGLACLYAVVLAAHNAPVAQWIEYCPPKAGVAGSIPAGRTKSDKGFRPILFQKKRCTLKVGQILPHYLTRTSPDADSVVVRTSSITKHWSAAALRHAGWLDRERDERCGRDNDGPIGFASQSRPIWVGSFSIRA